MIIFRAIAAKLIQTNRNCIVPALTRNNRYTIIAELFRKRNQRKQQAQQTQQTRAKPADPQTEHQQPTLPEDQEYDYFERHKQIDTGFDFSRLKDSGSEDIPDSIGKGGFEQVLYWSQIAKSPQKIALIVSGFNRVVKPRRLSQSNIHLEQFKGKVASTVYLCDTLQGLHEYSRFAFKYDLGGQQFWEKVQFRCVKIVPGGEQERGYLVDIGFMMGQLGVGADIYNHIAKMLLAEELGVDQYVKLYLTFHLLRQGEKAWIDKLLAGINEQVHLADPEQLATVLPPLKEAKQLPATLNAKLQARTIQLMDEFSLKQLMGIAQYFGFDHQNEQFWRLLQRRVEALLPKEMSVELLSQLIQKVLVTYRFSTDFVRRRIVGPIEASELRLLSGLGVLGLSGLSKGLYIYELEGETKRVEEAISGLVIGKVTAQISDLTDKEVVKVIQDYNLTRNGTRQLYIFLEEVVRARYLRSYDHHSDRHTLQMLMQIYTNSGMCSRQMYQKLQSLLLE